MQPAFAARDATEPPALVFRDDEAGATARAAAARVQPPFAKRKAVVVGELLAGRDVAARDDPDPAAHDFDAAVRRAGMVDEPGHAAAHSTIEIVPAIEHENVDAAIAAALQACEPLGFASLRFGFADSFAGVFDDARAVGDRSAGENAAAVNRRPAVHHARRGRGGQRAFHVGQACDDASRCANASSAASRRSR